MEDWDAIVKRLDRYNCPCGSGGAIACDDDCPGDTTDDVVKDTLRAVIRAVREIEKRRYGF